MTAITFLNWIVQTHGFGTILSATHWSDVVIGDEA
jgi:hypothetical protein